jgi:hypothetical protein
VETTLEQQPKLAAVVKQVAKDLRTIAADEIELGQHALAGHLGHMVKRAAIALVGAIVALIGFAMLCTAAVAALAPVIPPLWLRLVIMAVVYVGVGGGVLYYFARKVAEAKPDLGRPAAELSDTVDAIKKGLAH